MRKACPVALDELIDFVDGKGRPEFTHHLFACAKCQEQVRRFRQILSLVSEEHHDAARETIDAAKSLFQPRPRRVASLISRSLSQQGVRRASADSFQLVFQVGVRVLRLMYVEGDGHWQVTGRLDPPKGEVFWQTSPLPMDETGKFEFVTAKIEESGLIFREADEVILVPSAVEASQDDTDGPS